MLHLSFAKDLECYHQLDKQELLSIALVITEEALSQSCYEVDNARGIRQYSGRIKEYLESKGMQFEKAVITYYDIDSICLSLDPEATSESDVDVSIRTWDIYVDWEKNPDAVHVDWTFHIFGDFQDMPKTGSRVLNDTSNGNGVLIDGSNDILVDGDYYGLDSIGNDTGFTQLTKDELDRLLAAARSGNGGCRTSRWYQIWFQAMCNRPDLCGINESDDEIRTLTIVKNSFQYINDGYDLSQYVLKYIADKFRQEWYKNYIGTKKITFDGPTNYKETGEITDEDISAFMSGAWNNFLNYRLKIGHTERQDRFTALMRDYPLEILGFIGEAIPYYFYEGLAKGGEYELYGCSIDEFIGILGGKSIDEQDEEFEYAAVLEDKYGIDYAVDFLFALDWKYSYVEGLPNGTDKYIVELFSRAVGLGDNAKALLAMGDLSATYLVDVFDLDFSVEMYARLATVWEKGLINDSWLTNVEYGLPDVFDWSWGDYMWEEDEYPDCPDEDKHRIWLLKLLESDFADDIADYLKPLLEMVLEREKNHNWETGKKAIKDFLAKTTK